MAFNNFLGDGEPKAAPMRLAITNKRLKDGTPNRNWNPGTVIPYVDLQLESATLRGYQDLPRLRRNCFTSVQNQICDCSLNPAGIKPANGFAFMSMGDRYFSELGSHPGHMDRSFNRLNTISLHWPYSFDFNRAFNRDEIISLMKSMAERISS
jgi:hypothetical protein